MLSLLCPEEQYMLDMNFIHIILSRLRDFFFLLEVRRLCGNMRIATLVLKRSK